MKPKQKLSDFRQQAVFIYALLDPVTHQVRYVGKTNDLNLRYRGHLSESRRGGVTYRKARWIAKLLRLGMKPIMQVLDESSTATWKDRECFWIQHFRLLGNLCNHTDGGEGIDNPDEETRAKMRAAKVGKIGSRLGSKPSEETRIKQSQSAIKRWLRMSEQERIVYFKKLSEASAMARKPISEETRGRMREAAAKRNASPEYRSKLSQAALSSPKCRRLSKADVLEIRNCLAKGQMQKEIAARFQISVPSISAIKHEKAYKDYAQIV